MTRSDVRSGALARSSQGYIGCAGSRWGRLALLSAVISVVSDGWSGKPSPWVHQLILLPALATAAYLLAVLLASDARNLEPTTCSEIASGWFFWLVAFEVLSVGLIWLEAAHFREFGYRVSATTWITFLALVIVSWAVYASRRSGTTLMFGLWFTYAAGLLLSIRSFPLNYLRSDMLPVIIWADERVLAHLNPYVTMHVGNRLYDFPYLPGMLVGYLPALALRIDVRFANLVYIGGVSILVFSLARDDRQREVAATLGLFLLCPFLQYRHDLYLEPHWFAVVLAVVLMRRERFYWAACAWGASCAIYQLSWVILPFVLLNAFWRRGFSEVLRMSLLVLAGAVAVAGAFLRLAARQVAHNTVGQWSHLSHALADPINLSFWVSYLVRPNQLMWVQAAVLIALFLGCVAKGRCRDLEDTLRWMIWALALFISLNVLVDGYFYLTLLLLLVLYVCVANQWWKAPGVNSRPGPMHSLRFVSSR